MKTATTALFVVLISLLGVAQNANWKPYVSKELGFELAYPAGYHQAELPCQIARSAATSGVQSLLYVKKGTGASEASIHVALDRRPFNMETLRSRASTGWEGPAQVEVGKYVFYFYGAGGGGVQYADRYYFNLNGRILSLVFDGPYASDSKSPSEETREVEERMLERFRLLNELRSGESAGGQPDHGKPED